MYIKVKLNNGEILTSAQLTDTPVEYVKEGIEKFFDGSYLTFTTERGTMTVAGSSQHSCRYVEVIEDEAPED